MGKNCHCKKLKCEDKHVIKCLPYHITCPGHYCLGKDFEWNNSGVAITVRSDNVVLDFNQRKITIKAPGASTVFVEDSSDVVLNDVDLEAIGEAAYARGGLYIFDSENIEVNSPALKNFASVVSGEFSVSEWKIPFSALRVNGLNVKNAFIKNDGVSDLDEGGEPIIGSCQNFSFNDFDLTNNRLIVANSSNGEILGGKVYNTAENRAIQIQVNDVDDAQFPGDCESIRVANCDIKIKLSPEIGLGGIGILVASFEFPPSRIVRNILIENNTISCVDEQLGAFTTGILLQGVEECVVRNNSIFSDGDTTEGIALIGVRGSSITDNNIYVKNGAYAGIDVTAAFFDSVPVLTTGNLFSGNNISSDGTVGIFGLSAGFYMFSEPDVAKYNTVEKNNVSSFQYGFIDGTIEGGPAKCTVFRENVANGNGENFNVDIYCPTNTIMINNVDRCINKELSPLSLDSQSVSKLNKDTQRRQLVKSGFGKKN